MCPNPTARSTTTKGALVAYRSDSRATGNSQKASSFVFQYNPETLVRVLSYQEAGLLTTDGQKPPHLSGSPEESISLAFDLDTTNQLEDSEQHGGSEYGLHPSLAALEAMMYPETGTGRKADFPLVIFHWGSKRIVPVRLTNMRVSEEAFDRNLNPIRARIELSMRVLRQSEFKRGSLGYSACRSHMNQKNSLALRHASSFDRGFTSPSSLSSNM